MSAVVVVESPAKAKTIEKYLGKGFKVLASYGHVRAFPKKDGSVDPDENFAIKYEIIADKKKRLDAIATALKKADQLILASDPDREGEAIAWHVAEVMRERGLLEEREVQRVSFHEITKKAITAAFANPTEINSDLVDAQQARSSLDYLVGFTLSPLLWRKIRSGLSAGRVQSVALRVVCEREQHIRDFKPREYWTVESECEGKQGVFTARLHAESGRKLTKFAITNDKDAKALTRRISNASFTVASVTKKEIRQNPPPPFITSTLQMEAARKLGFTARKTMQLAQRLYEGIEVDGELTGLITYMRTDSVTLSDDALDELRLMIRDRFGNDYLPDRARRFKNRSKNAQEAHEAIRPSLSARTPERLKESLDGEQWRLYNLIWQRTVASQMSAATLDQVSVDICGDDLTLRATGSTLRFAGFRKLYVEGRDDNGKDDGDRLLPPLQEGEAVVITSCQPKQHFTEPKPRFSEATLVKELESHGIGRPSTYASILNVLRTREYVEMERNRFLPTEVGEWVNRFLVDNFENIVDTGFTSGIEDRLDAVARGEQGWKPLLQQFWQPFKADVDRAADAQRPVEETKESCPECSKPLAIKLGRYGKFFACTGYPECRYSRPLNSDKREAAEVELSDEVCEKCGAPMAVKVGRYGKFLGCSAYPKCKNIQPMERPKDSGITCPECNEGTFLEKRSRRGKIFYSCSRYPKCKNALWNKPIDRSCPECKAPFVTEKTTKRNGTEQLCASEGCGWRVKVADESAE
ncbi:MAG: type I DNA topoisomerase [Mariprofundales bacterium]|nr:type I DNA topoisomerase [Mariprofundales bacterium]